MSTGSLSRLEQSVGLLQVSTWNKQCELLAPAHMHGLTGPSDEFHAQERALGKRTSAADRSVLEERRQRLYTRVRNFEKTAGRMLGPINAEEPDNNNNSNNGTSTTELDDNLPNQTWSDDEESDEEADDDTGVEDEEIINLKPAALALPSKWSLNRRDASAQTQELVKIELELRTGQADEALEALRMALGYQSAIYRTTVRMSKTQGMSTRAQSIAQQAHGKVLKLARMYRRAHAAMVALGAEDQLLRRFRRLKKEDLSVSKDVTEENRHSQRNDVLSWIWHTSKNHEGDSAKSEWLMECAC